MDTKKVKNKLRKVFPYVLVLIILIFFAFPLASIFLMSIRPATLVAQPTLNFTPTLASYAKIFEGGYFNCLVNSAIIASLTTVLTLFAACFASYSISRFRFRGRSSIFGLSFAMRTVPPIAFVLPLFFIWNDLGLYDTYFGLMLAMTALRLTLAILLLKAFFDGISVDIEESAMVDGCSRLGALRRIVLPLAAPGLAVVAIFAFIFTWNDLATALILTGRGVKTVPVFLAGMRGQYGIEWGPLAAGCITYTIPVLIIAFLIQRHIVRGLTFGAVKG